MVVEILKDSILDNYILGKTKFDLSITSNDILEQIKEKIATFKKKQNKTSR